MKTLELLNFEGPVLVLKKNDKDSFKLYDEWNEHIATWNREDIYEFLNGNIAIVDSQGREWNYTSVSKDAKPLLDDIANFLSI